MLLFAVPTKWLVYKTQFYRFILSVTLSCVILGSSSCSFAWIILCILWLLNIFILMSSLEGGHFDWFNICSARGNLAYFRLFQRLVDLARFNLDRRRSACCLQLLPWPWTPSRPSHWNISLFLFNNLTEL